MRDESGGSNSIVPDRSGEYVRWCLHQRMNAPVPNPLRNFTNNKNADRKITRFPKRKLLEHGRVMAVKYGFNVELVNPADTGVLGGKLTKPLCLDIHTSSAYAVALRCLSEGTFERLLSLET